MGCEEGEFGESVMWCVDVGFGMGVLWVGFNRKVSCGFEASTRSRNSLTISLALHEQHLEYVSTTNSWSSVISYLVF